MVIVSQSKLHSPRVIVLSNFAFTELVIFGSINSTISVQCLFLCIILTMVHMAYELVFYTKWHRKYTMLGIELCETLLLPQEWHLMVKVLLFVQYFVY